MKQPVYIIIGTEAELIKMMLIIQYLIENNIQIRIIASGQNDISKSPILNYLHIEHVDLVLFNKPVIQTPFGLLYWFLCSFINGTKKLTVEREGVGSFSNKWLIIHGDTVTTVLGALLGRLFGFKVAHVEAGYKSTSLFYPFPEEIDRTIGSFFSDLLFCPFDSIGKLYKMNRPFVNIGFNTSIDSLNLALSLKKELIIKDKLNRNKYYIFALHRQEALLNHGLVKQMFNLVLTTPAKFKCVIPLHGPTEAVLNKLGLLEALKKNLNVILLPRISYFDYVHLLNQAEFIMTDGVGNQQETYYLGKPCLILRKQIEGLEGLGKNALLSNLNFKIISNFFLKYNDYKTERITTKSSPSKIIADYLINTIHN